MTAYFAATALLPEGWASDVRFDVDESGALAAVTPGGDPGGAERLAGELGDILFGYVNVARHLGVDPEEALRRCNAKFIRRFRSIEADLAKSGRDPIDATLEEMESLWNAAKAKEKA